MQKFIQLTVLLCAVLISYAQEHSGKHRYGSDSIEIAKTFGGYRVCQHNLGCLKNNCKMHLG